MTSDISDAAVLEATWHEKIPLAAAMQLRVTDYAGSTLTTTAPLEPNVNLHGTAFAGSLYSIAALTGWGYVWRLARHAGIDGDIVLGEGRIEYLRPVGGTITCIAHATAADCAEFSTRLAAGQPSRLRVECTVEFAARPAVRFTGDYHMRPADCT